MQGCTLSLEITVLERSQGFFNVKTIINFYACIFNFDLIMLHLLESNSDYPTHCGTIHYYS